VEIEQRQAELVAADKPSDAGMDDRLESLYRENVRISEQVQHIIEGKSDDMNLLDSIRVLQGLRQASEDLSSQASSQIQSRRDASASSKGRSTAPPKRKAATDEAEEGSAAPSPRIAANRLSAADNSSKPKPRGSSAQPPTREVSVKIEDGDSIASSVEGIKTSTPMSENGVRSRLTLSVGDMVFYRNKGRAQEGEGILCRVTSVIGEGKQRRYEIQDADPDPAPGTGEIPAPYRASVSHLVPIPSNNAGLPDLPKGKHVLAQYPDTTTFYKAEVSTAWKGKEQGPVKLRFEGEMDESRETEVERRLVLIEK